GAHDPNLPSGTAILLPGGTMDGTGGSPSDIAWSHSPLPTGATFDPATGTLNWTPSNGQAGDYTVAFTIANNGDGTGTPSSATTTLNLLIQSSNAPPVISFIPTQVVNVGKDLNLPITATAPAADTITLSVQGLPAFAGFVPTGNGTGSIQGTPQATD